MNNNLNAKILKFLKRHYPFVFSVTIVLVFILLFYYLTKVANTNNTKLADPIESPSSNEIIVMYKNPFLEVEKDLESEAVYVYDIKNKKEIFIKNANAQLALASLTKIMTAVVADEISPEYTTIQVDADDFTPEGDSGLKLNEKWNIKNLLKFVLAVSSNDGAKAAATALSFNESIGDSFLETMNLKSKNLGLNQTFFLNETGLDISGSTSGGYGSAKDVATLIVYAVDKHKDLFTETISSNSRISSFDYSHDIINTNQVVNQIPSVIASKTGFTDISGGNLAIVFDAGIDRPFVAVVLGSSIDGRFNDMLKIVNKTLEYSILN